MGLDISTLLFYVESGFVAGHDVGFHFCDFLVEFFKLSDKDKLSFKDVLLKRLDLLSIPQELEGSSAVRIDGSGLEVSNEVWKDEVVKKLRIFDAAYSSSVVINYLAWLAGVSFNDRQDAFHKHSLLCAVSVKVTPMSEVFTEKELLRIKKLNPKVKQCYKNSLDLARLFPGRVQYVEGKTLVCGVPIDHAFNKVGDKYVDVTLDLVLNDNVRSKEYVSLLEVPYEEVVRLNSLSSFLGDCFVSKYKNDLV